MIVLRAQLQCCKCMAEADITLDIVQNTEQGWSRIEVGLIPAGWKADRIEGDHYCPKHNPMK